MPAPAAPVQQFVVLPTRGLRATAATSSPALAPFLIDFGTAQTAAAAKSFVTSANLKVKPAFRVLDSIHEDGAKLVEMSDDIAKDLLAHQPGLRIVPVVYFRPLLVRYQVEQKVRAAAAGPAARLTVTVVSKAGNKPVKGATVVAFTDFANRLGAQGTTNTQGVVKLRRSSASMSTQRKTSGERCAGTFRRAPPSRSSSTRRRLTSPMR
jgi:subtilisin